MRGLRILAVRHILTLADICQRACRATIFFCVLFRDFCGVCEFFYYGKSFPIAPWAVNLAQPGFHILKFSFLEFFFEFRDFKVFFLDSTSKGNKLDRYKPLPSKGGMMYPEFESFPSTCPYITETPKRHNSQRPARPRGRQALIVSCAALDL